MVKSSAKPLYQPNTVLSQGLVIGAVAVDEDGAVGLVEIVEAPFLPTAQASTTP